MKLKAICVLLIVVIASAAVAAPARAQRTAPAAGKRTEKANPTARDYPVKPVPFTAVHFNDQFWLPRIEINRRVTIPFAFEQCEETGRVANLERAAPPFATSRTATRSCRLTPSTTRTFIK